ncbi:MAG: hypothetical protein NTY08_18045 [Proteobacteria bacterium]|nr:hypothetical protein [Pseudomonadota bacterium]
MGSISSHNRADQPQVASSDLKPVRPLGAKTLSGSEGFTLVGAIVMVAFIGIFIYVLSMSMRNSAFIRRIVETSSSHKDIESSFQTMLVDEVHRMLKPVAGGVCSGAPISIVNRQVGNDGVMFSTKTAIAAWPADAPAKHVAALRRCASGFRSLPSSQDLYFCVEFSGIGNANYSGTSFNGAPKAIAEVRARVLNLDSGLPLTCSEYASAYNAFQSYRFNRDSYNNCRANPASCNPLCQPISNSPCLVADKSGSSSVEVQYSIYWYSRGKPNIYKRSNGSFYAPSM